MKIKRLYLLGIGLMFTSQFLTSCHDLLEKDPTDSYSETVAWSSESSLDMYVTYLYKPLNGLSNFSSLSLTDGYTDLVKYGNGVPQTWSAHNKILLQQNTITSDNNPMSSWGLYTDIFRENVFLRDAGIYGSKFNEDFLNTRIAEIRFIRAVNYARMIRIFGGVILRDETNGVDSEGEKAKARATEDVLENAKLYQAEVLEDMEELRKSADEAETLIPDDLLPYPTYGKLLFYI